MPPNITVHFTRFTKRMEGLFCLLLDEGLKLAIELAFHGVISKIIASNIIQEKYKHGKGDYVKDAVEQASWRTI